MAPTEPRYAGQSPRYPDTGERVRVIEGEHAGQLVEVVGQGGSAFAAARHVIVRTAAGELVWYWPWNLSEG